MPCHEHESRGSWYKFTGGPENEVLSIQMSVCVKNYSVLPAAGSNYCLKHLEEWKTAFFFRSEV